MLPPIASVAASKMSSESSSDEDEGSSWDKTLKRIKRNDPRVESISPRDDIEDMTGGEWEELGRDISNNTHLTDIYLLYGAINDHQMSSLFRGLTRSSSINQMGLYNNGLSVAAIRSVVPFLKNANNLTYLDLSYNNLQSDGFNAMFRALRNSPIETLNCNKCGITSIEINCFPKYLKGLQLKSNNISADGCRELAKLLQGGDATLVELRLCNNKVYDEGVAILVEALQTNIKLKTLNLQDNRISSRGQILLLKLVNDISSIEATLRSNHTLTKIFVRDLGNEYYVDDRNKEIQMQIHRVTQMINGDASNQQVIGGQKVIWTQLHSEIRAKLAELQGVTNSVYSEIDTLYLPEVLALISKCNGRKELFPALKSSMVGLLSRVDMKMCIQEQVARHEAEIIRHREEAAYHEARIRAMISEHESMISAHGAKIEKLNNRLTAMEDPDADADQNMYHDTKTQSSKRRRIDE